MPAFSTPNSTTVSNYSQNYIAAVAVAVAVTALLFQHAGDSMVQTLWVHMHQNGKGDGKNAGCFAKSLQMKHVMTHSLCKLPA